MDRKQRDGTGPGNNRHHFQGQCEDMEVEFIGETEGDLWLKSFGNDQSMHASSRSLTSSTTDPPRSTSPCSASRSPRTAPPKMSASTTASTSQGAVRQRCIGCGVQIAKGSTFFDVVDEQTEDGVEIGWCFTCTIISGLNTGRAHKICTNSQSTERPNQAAPDVEVGRQLRSSNMQRTKQTEGDPDAKNVATESSKKRVRADTTSTQHSHAQDVVSSSGKAPSKAISSSATTSLGFGLKAENENSNMRGSTPHIPNPQSAYLNQDNPVLLHPPKAPALPGIHRLGSTNAKRSKRNQSETQTSKTNMVSTRAKYEILHHHDIESKGTIGRGKGGSTAGGSTTAGGTVPSVAGAAYGKDAPAWQAKSKSNRFRIFSHVGDASNNSKSMDDFPQFHIGTSSAPKHTSSGGKGRSGFAIKSYDRRNMKAVPGAKKAGNSRNVNQEPDATRSGDAKVKSGPSSSLLVVVDGSNVAFGFDEIVSRPQFSLKGILLALQYFEERGVDVVALVPRYRINSIQPQHEHHAALVRVMSRGLISVVPQKTSDDLFILSYAVPRSAYVVTNDQFRDHMRTPSTLESLGLQRHELEKFLADHLVPYTFVRGEFTPNPTSPIIKELTRKAKTKGDRITSLGSESGGSGLKAQASVGADAPEIAPEGTDANPIVISPGP